LGQEPEMTSSSLTALLDLLEEAGMENWLDGGWGVDALLRTQSRPHKDVDLILRVADVSRLLDILGSRGFVVCEGSLPNSFVLANGTGLEVDVHAVVFDGEGNGVYRMQNGQDWVYPAAGFAGQGEVGDRKVHCLSPEVQVLCHAEGYTPTDKDMRDMQLLEELFCLDLPPQLKPKPR
jgi:lincosamide nucleotidyltransferase A/C/D/E